MPGVLLVQFLNLAVVTASTGKLIFHAAGLSKGDRTVVLSGTSGSGKTTLTAGLIARGWDYLSDEAVVVDPTTRRITPYPKPLTVKAGSQPVLAAYAPVPSRYAEPTWQVPASQIRAGCVVRHDECTPTHVLLPRYDASATASVDAVSRATAMMALGQNTSRLGHLFPHALDAIAGATEGCATGRLVFGDLDAACDAIETMV